MEIRLIIALCCVLFLSDNVFAEGESEIKKGHYPFMAFIFYPDETIIEGSGLRFLRGAVLVKPEWLITSSVVPMMINDTPIGFPRKTLLARLGSVSIDANITLNEDEDEQEREVIQLVRPNNHSEAQWWRNDITLLKTLLPFNLTSAVGTATIRTKPGIISNSNCFMLIYAVTKKFGNWTEERVLMKLFVELQSGSQGSCGSHFHEDTMLCAIDSEDNKDIVYEPEYCKGNSGAPLICENEVSGLQTYVENNCKPPHLYQLLSAWDNFITCGIENKCREEQCSNMCTVVNKDEPVTKGNTASIEQNIVYLVSVTEPEVTTMEPTTVPFVSEVIETTKPSPPTPTSTAILQQVTKETTATTTTTTTNATSSTTTSTTLVEISEETEVPSWPKEKYPDAVKSFEEDKMERKTNVEAQRQNQYLVDHPPNAADRNIAVPISLLLQFILVSLII